MAVTSRELRTVPARERAAPVPRRDTSPLTRITFLLISGILLYLLVSTGVHWGRVLLDDLRYGRPRTTHLQGFVGHAEASGQPSHFIALNLNRQVVVLELPGGDPAQVRSLPGPYLFGADEDLTPVQLALDDVDGDGANDLLINVRNEQLVYLNKDGNFRLPSPEERQQLMATP
jgi:hypothetical protein